MIPADGTTASGSTRGRGTGPPTRAADLAEFAETRIFLRPLGSTLPLGLFSVAVASALLSAREIDLLSPSETMPIALAPAASTRSRSRW